MKHLLFFPVVLWVLAGCSGESAEQPEIDGPTYYEHVAPILEKSCNGCHEPGNIGPFSFGSYEEALSYADIIAPVVRSKQMPPFPPRNDGSCRELVDERVMNDADRQTLLDWVEAGAPEGDPTAAPTAAVVDIDLAEDLGQPTSYADWGFDFQPTEGLYEEWRCLLVDPGWEEAVHLKAVGVEPGNRGVVHHIIVMGVLPGNDAALAELEGEDEIPGYWCPNGSRIDGTFNIAGYAPGSPTRPFPDGATVTLPPGTKFLMQMHYNYAAVRENDVSKALFWEVDEPSDKRPKRLTLVNQWFEIPKGAVSYTAEGFSKIVGVGEPRPTLLSQEEGMAWGVSAHMHTLGKEAKIELLREDGTEECLLHIPKWDFSWQGSYRFKEPLELYKGDRVKISCTWDNSQENQAIGPDGQQIETRTVIWGDGTFDEMCLGGVSMTSF